MGDQLSAKTVVAIDHRFGDIEIEQAVLQPHGVRVIDATTMEPDDAMAACVSADGILVGPRLRFDAARLATLNRCRVIVRYGVGVDNIDVRAARTRGIIVCNVPDYCVEEVATHALAMILALNRDLVALDQTVRNGNWRIRDDNRIQRVSSLTLGIVGFGRIGEALGRRALALGMIVLASDPVRSSHDIEAAGVKCVSLDELLAVSDFVSIHASSGHGDRAVLDSDAIHRMKPGAYVVNVARSGLVDQEALIAALRDGRLAGAALDVVDPEPLGPDAPILSADNVILTPHVAWYSSMAIVELRRKAAEEAARVLGGSDALNVVSA